MKNILSCSSLAIYSKAYKVAKGHRAETRPAKIMPRPSTLKLMERFPVKFARVKMLSDLCISKYHTKMLLIITAASRKISI